jgi:hypothetical protein
MVEQKNGWTKKMAEQKMVEQKNGRTSASEP